MKKTLFIAMAGVLAMASCKQKPNREPVDPSIMVKTAAVTSEAFALPIASSGVITSDKESRLSFKTGGIISKLLANEGDFVVKGQLLAKLNPTELDAQLAFNENALEKAVRDHDRSEKLYKDSSATLEEYQNTKTDVRAALQNYKAAKFNKALSAIYANQTGRVIKKMANEGEVTNPGAVVYVINSTAENDWVVRLGVADRDWARIKPGDRAVLTTDTYPGKQFRATVWEIGEGADAATGTFLIKVKVQRGQARLANGLTAKVVIMPSAAQQYRFIPVEALIEANEETATVYSPSSNGRGVIKHAVRVAHVLGNKVALSSGLEGVSKVITDGAAYLTMSSTIKILNQSGSPAILNVKQ